MGLDEVAERLYAASPDDFVALRSEAAKAARAAGDRPLATAIGGLRRPTRSAWLVNLLARAAAAELAALLDLGAALREAQVSMAGAELRRLSAERHRAVDALARRAAEIGAKQGYSATDAVQQEISQTLQAALADHDLGEQVRRGTVAAAVAYGGFGPFELGPAEPAKAPHPPAPPPVPAVEGSDNAERQAAAEAAAKASAAYEQAERDRQVAEAEADATSNEADRLADRADSLRAELATVEQDEKQTRTAARAARKRLDELTRQAEAAQQAAETARAAANAYG